MAQGDATLFKPISGMFWVQPFNLKRKFFFIQAKVEKQITGHRCPYNGKNHEIVSCFEGTLLTEAEGNEFIALFLSWLHMEIDKSIVWFRQFYLLPDTIKC